MFEVLSPFPWNFCYHPQPFAKRGLRHFNWLNPWKAVFESLLGDKNVKTNRGLRKTCIVQAIGWPLTWRSLAGWCLILRMSCSSLGCTPKCSKVFDHCFPSCVFFAAYPWAPWLVACGIIIVKGVSSHLKAMVHDGACYFHLEAPTSYPLHSTYFVYLIVLQ